MTIYDYSNIKNCFICGDIEGNFEKFTKSIINGLKNISKYAPKPHPKEIEREEKLRQKIIEMGNNPSFIQNIEASYLSSMSSKKKIRKNNSIFNDSLIIINGLNNFEDKLVEYYNKKLEMLNSLLADNSSHILFVRGNDNPDFYNKELINLSNIKTIQDYAVIKLANFNCLCIGGCISIDRTWKQSQEKSIGKKKYWENENFIYKKDEIEKIIKTYNIACVVTNSSPTFAYPSNNSFKNTAWASKDKTILKDMSKERISMDKIYSKLIEFDKIPYVWFYTRFTSSHQETINNILFYSLARFRILNFNELVLSYYGINLNDEKEQPKKEKKDNMLGMPLSGAHWDDLYDHYNQQERTIDFEEFLNEENDMEEDLGREMNGNDIVYSIPTSITSINATLDIGQLNR